LAVLLIGSVSALAQEPDPSVCDGFDCDNLPGEICDPGGFLVSLTDFVAADDPTNFTGNAIYTYQICNPPAGTCTGNPQRSCLDNNKCAQFGEGTCDRECAVDSFRGLSHFNIDFPDLGGESCLSEDNFVGGSCTCVPANGGCSVDPSIVLGDGSCYGPNSTVAKCDNTTLPEGACIEMELQIAGESNDLGLGTAVVVSKESGDCNESCIAGPSCDRCDEPGTGNGECLTRTLGFWGTHPWITNDFAPVEVCGETVGCFGPDDGMSDPSCPAGTCDSIMEALGSSGGELKHGSAYIALVRQLTAAKLNLAATAGAFGGAECSDWMFGGKTIQGWIDYCEGLCNKSQSQISGSGCIEALDDFNNSLDILPDDVTPAPFDRPPVDDAGNISGADPSGFTSSNANGVVIGKNVPGGTNCN
jgi:hypothetical protein